MPLTRRHLLHAGTASLLLPAALRAQPVAPPAPPAPPDDAALRALLAARLQHEGVALAAARLRPGGGLVLAAASRAGAEAVSTDRHVFEIGSITKVFTGLLLAEAVLRGEVPLDGAVEAQLGFPLRDSAGQPLRYVDLATHRSGLPRLAPNMKPAREAVPYADYSEAQLLEALRDYRATRRRDERFEYSNFATGLLGWLLARAAKQPLMALVQSRLFEPLGLAGPAGLQRVGGHNAEGRPVPGWDFSEPTAAAGALLLSAAQLARFGQAALGQFEHPLRPAFALAMQVHSPLGLQPGLQMGLGWMLSEQGGRRLATHDGATFGFTASLWLDLNGQRGGLVLSNASVNMADIARHLMDERLPLRDVAAEKKIQAQDVVSLAPAQLAPLAGVYAASPQFRLSVRAREGRLFAQATGQPEFELYAAAPRRFFARLSPLQIEFEGESGTPARLVIEQGGRKTVFRREGDEMPPLQLPPQALQALAGVYALNPGFKLSLRTEGPRLFARATGQGEFELFATGPREFEARVAPIAIRFEAGDPPPALELQQGGQSSRFVRE